MSRNLRIFLTSFLASFFLWGGINILTNYLENFIFPEVYQSSPQLFLAQANPYLQKKEAPEIGAKSAISIKIDKLGREKIVFKKNPDEILPIASLTKLMTALVALEYYQPSQIIKVSKEAVGQPENFGQLKIGEELSAENLLYITLIESSNDAAYALSEIISQEAFVDLMNIEAKGLGLKNTYFAEPAGYESGNRSTARDLVKFSQYLVNKRPEIWEITAHDKFDLYDPRGIFHHQLLNTNETLNELPEIVGGKTGYTTEAGGCLLLILKDKRTENIFIHIVLDSINRSEDMRKLIDYAF